MAVTKPDAETETGNYQLAELNVGRLRAPLDSPQLADFVGALAPVNALADASPGFVWRLQTDDDGDATSVQAFCRPRVTTSAQPPTHRGSRPADGRARVRPL